MGKRVWGFILVCCSAGMFIMWLLPDGWLTFCLIFAFLFFGFKLCGGK